MSRPRVPLDLHHAADIARQIGNPDLIRYLSRAISEVERQPCRFRCRTNREAYIAGFLKCEGMYATFQGGDADKDSATEFALNGYRNWRKEHECG